MNTKTGLICEGGGTKAAYTSGVLKAFLDYDVQFPYTVGISAGAENLLPYISKQPDRLVLTGVEAGAQKDAVGIRPLFKEGTLFGLNATFKFLEENAPLDFETFQNNETKLDIGVYNIETGKIEYYDKTYLTKDQTLIMASCALILLTKPYKFNNGLYMDAGLIDMIPIEQSLRAGNEKHVFISTKEENYTRKPAGKYQIRLAKWKYRKYPHIAEALQQRHINYEKQWKVIKELEMEGKALILRPSEDQGITRYTKDKEKLTAWYELGYQDTVDRMDKIKEFIK